MKITEQKFNFHFGENAIYQLFFIDEKHLDVTVVKDLHYQPGTRNHFEVQMTQIRLGLCMVNWTE